MQLDTNPPGLLDPELPAFLQVEITSHCNLKCFMCPLTDGLTASSAGLGHMPDPIWAKILPLAQRAGQVFIAGFGEPFAHPRCTDLLRQLDERNVSTCLVTNGTLLTPRLCAELDAIRHLFQINVSVDSLDPETYRSIRRGDLNRVLTGLRNLMAAVAEPSRVSVSCVATTRNLPSLADFPARLEEMGVRTLVIQSLTPYSADIEQEHLCGGESVAQHLAAIESAASKHHVNLDFTLRARLDLEADDPGKATSLYLGAIPADSDLTRQCALPWEAPFIDKDGRVFPCCLASSHTDAQLGDLRQETLEGVWAGERYRAFRASMLRGNRLAEVCRTCSAVPAGRHPFLDYSAEVCPDESVLSAQKRLRLVVRNTGAKRWSREDQVHLGTAGPHDRPSSLHHPEWLSPNRVGTFQETAVAPGEKATFVFRVRPSAEIQDFQLVVEGRCWLPSTRVHVGPVRSWTEPGLVAWRQLRGTLGKVRRRWRSLHRRLRPDPAAR